MLARFLETENGHQAVLLITGEDFEKQKTLQGAARSEADTNFFCPEPFGTELMAKVLVEGLAPNNLLESRTKADMGAGFVILKRADW